MATRIDDATAGLDHHVKSADLALISTLCTKAGADSQTKASPPHLRLFSTWEITRYMIHVAPGHFRRVLGANPDLPQGQSDTEGGARWFTFDEIIQLRQSFATLGSKAKDYLPYRPAGAKARIVTLANIHAGAGKTTTAAHLAIAAALDGYRVLVIDMDPQARLSAVLGGKAADEWGTVLPLLARHHGRHLQTENRQRVMRGEDPVSLDKTLDQALALNPDSLIQQTIWPMISLLPAQLGLCKAELQVQSWRQRSRGWKAWTALRETLIVDQVLERYDIVVIDTPPAFGTLTLAAVAAADLLLVPLGATADDLQGTGAFFSLMHQNFEAIEQTEALAARALGQPAVSLNWPVLRAVLNKVDPASQGAMASQIQSLLGKTMIPWRQDLSDILTANREGATTVYGTDYRMVGRDAWCREREGFDATYAAIKALLTGLWQHELANPAS